MNSRDLLPKLVAALPKAASRAEVAKATKMVTRHVLQERKENWADLYEWAAELDDQDQQDGSIHPDEYPDDDTVGLDDTDADWARLCYGDDDEPEEEELGSDLEEVEEEGESEESEGEMEILEQTFMVSSNFAKMSLAAGASARAESTSKEAAAANDGDACEDDIEDDDDDDKFNISLESVATALDEIIARPTTDFVTRDNLDRRSEAVAAAVAADYIDCCACRQPAFKPRERSYSIRRFLCVNCLIEKHGFDQVAEEVRFRRSAEKKANAAYAATPSSQPRPKAGEVTADRRCLVCNVNPVSSRQAFCNSCKEDRFTGFSQRRRSPSYEDRRQTNGSGEVTASGRRPRLPDQDDGYFHHREDRRHHELSSRSDRSVQRPGGVASQSQSHLYDYYREDGVKVTPRSERSSRRQRLVHGQDGLEPDLDERPKIERGPSKLKVGRRELKSLGLDFGASQAFEQRPRGRQEDEYRREKEVFSRYRQSESSDVSDLTSTTYTTTDEDDAEDDFYPNEGQRLPRPLPNLPNRRGYDEEEEVRSFKVRSAVDNRTPNSRDKRLAAKSSMPQPEDDEKLNVWSSSDNDSDGSDVSTETAIDRTVVVSAARAPEAKEELGEAYDDDDDVDYMKTCVLCERNPIPPDSEDFQACIDCLEGHEDCEEEGCKTCESIEREVSNLTQIRDLTLTSQVSTPSSSARITPVKRRAPPATAAACLFRDEDDDHRYKTPSRTSTRGNRQQGRYQETEGHPPLDEAVSPSGFKRIEGREFTASPGPRRGTASPGGARKPTAVEAAPEFRSPHYHHARRNLTWTEPRPRPHSPQRPMSTSSKSATKSRDRVKSSSGQVETARHGASISLPRQPALRSNRSMPNSPLKPRGSNSSMGNEMLISALHRNQRESVLRQRSQSSSSREVSMSSRSTASESRRSQPSSTRRRLHYPDPNETYNIF